MMKFISVCLALLAVGSSAAFTCSPTTSTCVESSHGHSSSESCEAVCSPCDAITPSHVNREFASRHVNHWDMNSEAIEEKISEWRSIVDELPAYPEGSFKGRGAVLVAHALQTQSLLSTVSMLRKSGFALPIEIFHLGDEVSDAVLSALGAVEGVTVRNFFSLPVDVTTFDEAEAVALKPLAVLHSTFEQVLSLDADTAPMADPSALFAAKEFRSNGALFWRGHTKTHPVNPMWAMTARSCVNSHAPSSSQFVVDKKDGWNALNLAVHFAGAFYQNFVESDADAVRFAYLATETPYSFVEKKASVAGNFYNDAKPAAAPASIAARLNSYSAPSGTVGTFCGHSDVHHHPLTGEPLFLHHGGMRSSISKELGPSAGRFEARQNWPIIRSVHHRHAHNTRAVYSHIEHEGANMRCLDLAQVTTPIKDLEENTPVSGSDLEWSTTSPYFEQMMLDSAAATPTDVAVAQMNAEAEHVRHFKAQEIVAPVAANGTTTIIETQVQTFDIVISAPVTTTNNKGETVEEVIATISINLNVVNTITTGDTTNTGVISTAEQNNQQTTTAEINGVPGGQRFEIAAVEISRNQDFFASADSTISAGDSPSQGYLCIQQINHPCDPSTADLTCNSIGCIIAAIVSVIDSIMLANGNVGGRRRLLATGTLDYTVGFIAQETVSSDYALTAAVIPQVVGDQLLASYVSIASVQGQAIVNPLSYINGRDASDPASKGDYIVPCATYSGLKTNDFFIRVTMGAFVDFFKIARTATLCDFLTQAGGWYYHSYSLNGKYAVLNGNHFSFLGGFAPDTAVDTRVRWGSFWGISERPLLAADGSVISVFRDIGGCGYISQSANALFSCGRKFNIHITRAPSTSPLASSLFSFDVKKFHLVARFDGTTTITRNQYQYGFQSQTEFSEPCGLYSGLTTLKSRVRITMGSYVDVFGIPPARDFCYFLTGTGAWYKYYGSNSAKDAAGVNKNGNSLSFLGGFNPSAGDSREYGPYWGINNPLLFSALGGCGHLNSGGQFGCGRAFTVEIQLL